MISLQPLESIKGESFICEEFKNEILANGLIRFKGEVGHNYVDLCLKYLNALLTKIANR